MNEKEKLLWDQFDDKAKAIILGRIMQTVKSSTNTTPKRNVNLHEILAFDFIQMNMHDSIPYTDPPVDNQVETETFDDDDPNNQILVNAATSSKPKLAPGDIKRVMSKSSTRSINVTKIVYTTSAARVSGSHKLSLVDRGANGGLAGTDVRVITTQKGPVVASMHQYALFGKGP